MARTVAVASCFEAACIETDGLETSCSSCESLRSEMLPVSCLEVTCAQSAFSVCGHGMRALWLQQQGLVYGSGTLHGPHGRDAGEMTAHIGKHKAQLGRARALARRHPGWINDVH